MIQKFKYLPLLFASYLISTLIYAEIDTDLLAGMKARNIGPATTSGRISDIEVVISNPSIIYASAASGGVWKSVNAGLNWQAIFDDQDYASTGALAINQQIPDIVWLGTGEGNVRNSTSIGGGIYKSMDGGKTWQKMGLEKTERINRIALHPTNPNIAYAAALGTLWSKNKERGLFKTVNGGKTWQNILYVDNTTGASDIKMDPTNPNKLYATMWEFSRLPYRFESGGPGSGLYISIDGGETWQRKTQEDGLPEGDLGRLTTAIAQSDPNVVYLLAEADKSALLRSNDGGSSWQTVNSDFNVADRPFYYSEIEVDPNDPDTIYNIATLLRRSIDGGKTFSVLDKVNCCATGNTVHIDNHSLWINPKNSKHIVLGNDGGVQITQDAGDSWRFVQNLPISQFYHVRVDNAHPYHIYGGLQDNGSWRGPGEIWQTAGIRNLHWQEIGFGDGFDAMPFPNDVTKGYSQSQGGALSRYDLTTGEERLIMPNPPKGEELRFNWNAGLAQDPFDENTIYYGSQFVHKSTDKGDTWQIISDDLSTNKKQWQRYKDSGGITPDVTAAENYTAIITIAPSPLKQGVIWVGTDDGRIHVTQDGGKSWTSVENKVRKGPKNAFVPHITPSEHDAGSAYIVLDNHRKGDMKPYVYKAEKYGKKFKSLVDKNLRGYALSIQQDHVDENLLFLGTELGLYVSTTHGEQWFKWDQGVPTVSVMDMAIQRRENDLILGTHGRSIFIIDDYSALRGLSEKSFNADLALLSVTDGQQYRASRAPSTRFWGDAAFVGENEDYGVVLTVMASGDFLTHPDAEKHKTQQIAKRHNRAKSKAASNQQKDEQEKSVNKARVEVRNAKGQLVRTFTHELKQGVNRIVWGLESDGAKRLPGNEPKEDKDILPAGYEVVPGEYQITVRLNEHKVMANAKVIADPRYKVSQAELEENFAMLSEVTQLWNVLSDAATALSDSKKDVELIQNVAQHTLDKIDGDKKGHVASKLVDSAKALLTQIKSLDELLRSQPKTKGIVDDSFRVQNHIGMADWYISTAYGKPSATAQAYLAIAKTKLSEGVEKVNNFLAKDMAEFKLSFADSGLTLLNQIQPIDLSK
ncbi:WD40/YVTN/BNR-like repeat-containing protein [Thalassotalea castellviae]|uniref:Sortilin N-terminal domain-containing protein n=1 Tax=Thalassotalea castellviae TaxID=3075612 RepID=A0ABU2ZXR4_9GAMM|nr:hypothetical protein [Thalassotalea sp. W431]MDT0602475.1 hypothetical protein [Thalassotalea sp. W431]